MVKRLSMDQVIAQWVRVGVLFAGRRSRHAVDPERLLLETACLAPGSARLYAAAVSWVSRYDSFIARHRLKRLIADELEPTSRAALGLLLDLAIKHGASRTLNIAAEVCGKCDAPYPLLDVHARSATRRRLARRSACPEALRRGLWAPDVEIKRDALRPASWIIAQNPTFRERAIRKGDLRCTILETLRRDAPARELASEQALTRLCAAQRVAVRAALDDLEIEGVRLRRDDPTDRRRTRIRLPAAAS